MTLGVFLYYSLLPLIGRFLRYCTSRDETSVEVPMKSHPDGSKQVELACGIALLKAQATGRDNVTTPPL